MKRDFTQTTRYKNVRLLAGKLASDSGSRGKGLQELADKINRSLAQVSSFAGDNPSKSIGTSLANIIESSCELPEGWLDVEHSSPLAKAMAGTASPSAPITPQSSTGHSPVVNTIIEKLLQLEKAGKDAELAAIESFIKKIMS